MATLLEAYKNRLAISESVYAKSHNGEKMSKLKKITTARCLENLNKFMNEAFDNSVGTQRSDMGLFKKFSLNLTTVALPNLIAFDLVIVYPMTAMSGYVNYIEYVAGSNKGQTRQGDVFNSPFGLGKVDQNYTSQVVVETLEAGTDNTLAWTPVVKGFFKDANGVVLGDVKVGNNYKWFNPENKKLYNQRTVVDGREVFDNANLYTATAGDKAAYVYDNVVIPQNDLPILNAQIKAIPLIARARRIAVYYSQIAAYQAKQDYGFDLGDQLAEKAVGQLSYEIDTEVTNMLVENAAHNEDLVWSKTAPVGVSKQDHYNGFMEIIGIAAQKIYDRTKRFSPNYMLIASNVLPIIQLMTAFKPAATTDINGPYFAGTLGALKVFVTPNIEAGKFVVGVNGSDLMSSAAVYAPYMPIVPTQLLGYADGGMSQGWSTMYDLKMLNANLLVAGRVTA